MSLIAFGHKSHHPVETILTFERLREVWSDPAVRVWVDLEAPTSDDLKALDSVVDLDDTALEATLQEEQRPRVDEFGDHIFLLLYGVLTPDVDPGFSPRKLSAFCGKRFLITIHADRHRTIEALKNRFPANGEHLMSRGVDFVLYTIIDGMVENYSVAITKFDEQLDALEERSMTDVSEEVFVEAASFRRQLLELRRLAIAQQEVLGPLARGECDYVAANLGRRFSHVLDHLTKTVELTDTLRELLNGVRENYQSSLTRRTNEIIRTLTIFASIMLPLSLVAGIYGMNLQTWPTMEHTWGFWAVLGSMGAVAAALGIFFRTRRWI